MNEVVCRGRQAPAVAATAVVRGLLLSLLLAGGCETRPVAPSPAGELPRDIHAGVPLSFSARVVGDKRPDFYSCKTILEAPQFRGKTGDVLTRALHVYFASPMDGCGPASGGSVVDRWPQMPGRVVDPIRMLNVYGWLLPGVVDQRQSNRETWAHTMDFVLRPGETLIRSQRDDGRCPLLAMLTHAPAPARYEPFQGGGNGRWIYEPNLTSGYLDFAAGVQDRTGLVQTAEGLSGAGACVIPFVSPYPFVAQPEVSGSRVSYHDGAWLTLCASGRVTLEICDALGAWQPVPIVANGQVERVDISPLVESRYAFTLRLTLDEGARVSRFRFEGYLLTAPMTIPRLEEGINVMTLRGRDKYGMMTVPHEVLPDFRKAAAPLDRQVAIRNGDVRCIDDWQRIVPRGDGAVQATFTFTAPARERFAWFYARAAVAERAAHAQPQEVGMEWRCGRGEFLPLLNAAAGGAPVQAGGGKEGEQILDRAGDTIEVRVTSAAPICGMEFVGHLAMGAALFVRPEITHRWVDDNVEHSFVAPQGADRYYFRCGPDPVGHEIEMTLPSYRNPGGFRLSSPPPRAYHQRNGQDSDSGR